MNRIKIFFISVLFLFMGCKGPNREEEAWKRYNEIVNLSQSGSYNLAKIKLDTLILLYGDQKEMVEKATDILNRLDILEQERNLMFLDSMLILQEALLEPLMKNFILSDEYGVEKLLIHKRQMPENSFYRTFIRAYLYESGKFFISSRYHGDKWIYHQQIRVYNDKQSVLSEIVAEDGHNNRRFEDQGSKWETVNYKDGKDNGIIDYIATYWNEPIKVQFIGKGNEYIVMEQFDKEAIRDGYEISFVLKEIERIKEEKNKTEKTLLKLR
ncbi:MAG: hypothetical protein FWH18_04485 [Marinilabiliaceae bacterium]|nr:hypothetical protein [Marinilabiliaceae bacterium]